MDSQHFIVNRDDLSERETVTMPRAPLAPDPAHRWRTGRRRSTDPINA
jgi:hypothetical protein